MDAILRQSFRSADEYSTYLDVHGDELRALWLWHETYGNQPGPIKLSGICDLCVCLTEFTAYPTYPLVAQFKHRADWIYMACGCGLSAVDRRVARLLADDPPQRLYHVGHYTPFRSWLSERYSVVSSQFVAGVSSGETRNGALVQDLTALSFADGEFDAVVAIDVLEHIPDYKSALHEVARVLHPGGKAQLTFPWRGLLYRDNIKRAEVLTDGSIHHIEAPEYHGDPASPEDGILCYWYFGWDVLDDMRAAGFRDAYVTFLFSPLNGHMTVLSPTIVGVR